MSDEHDADEVGCQIILTTGEHVGECKGTCTEREQTVTQWTQEFLARIEALELVADSHRERIAALEAQVRALREAERILHSSPLYGFTGTAGATQARPKDNGANLPNPEAPPRNTTTGSQFISN